METNEVKELTPTEEILENYLAAGNRISRFGTHWMITMKMILRTYCR